MEIDNEKSRARKERERKLDFNIAGEVVTYEDFKRYLSKASPLTLSTLMKAVKVEAYLDATKGEVSPKEKLVIALFIVLGVAAVLIYVLFFMPQDPGTTLTNTTVANGGV